MAPELVHHALGAAPKNAQVLDPMCGSGTVVRAAVESGLRCIGSDIDPLAILMARVWTTPLDIRSIRADAEYIVKEAEALAACDIEQSHDSETRKFISFWFAEPQEECLTRLATALRHYAKPTTDALAIALSRIIISKEKMASLARDTSHSRPHKVANSNDFDVYAGFLRSTNQVATRLKPDLINARAKILFSDARTLEHVEDKSFDIVLTSPPYLNAIDYMRGHRMALVWLGYDMNTLRGIRSNSVGTEKVIPETESPVNISKFVIAKENASGIKQQHLGWIRRYARDMNAVLRQLARAIKPNGKIVLVMGNSFLRRATVDNAGLIKELAACAGLQISDEFTRNIPARRRYLPPPGSGQSALDTRMRTETVLTFVT